MYQQGYLTFNNHNNQDAVDCVVGRTAEELVLLALPCDIMTERSGIDRKIRRRRKGGGSGRSVSREKLNGCPKYIIYDKSVQLYKLRVLIIYLYK